MAGRLGQLHLTLSRFSTNSSLSVSSFSFDLFLVDIFINSDLLRREAKRDSRQHTGRWQQMLVLGVIVTSDIRLTPAPVHSSPLLGQQKRRRRRNFLLGMCPSTPPPPALLLYCPLCLCLYSNCRPPLKAQSIWASFHIKMSNNSISVLTQTETLHLLYMNN